jgi:predicted dehydrogenase
MKVLVVGLGSMGRRRVRCLQEHGIEFISGFDTNAGRRDAVSREYGIDILGSLCANDLDHFGAVLVCTPPDQHHTVMAWAIERGLPCFVEASVIREPLVALLERASQMRSLVAPSCTLRFHPAIRDITAVVRSGKYGKVCNFSYHCGQYLPDWHPWEKVSDYYVSNPLTGGAREIVPFELTWMIDAFGWPVSVSGVRMRTTDVGAPIDDTYLALLCFDKFAGSMVVDVVARQAVRKLTLNFEQASLSWDWNEGIVRIYEAGAMRLVEMHQPKATAHAGYHQNISEAMYVEEVGSFLQAARGTATFPHTLAADIKILSLLESIENPAGSAAARNSNS